MKLKPGGKKRTLRLSLTKRKLYAPPTIVLFIYKLPSLFNGRMQHHCVTSVPWLCLQRQVGVTHVSHQGLRLESNIGKRCLLQKVARDIVSSSHGLV